MNPAAVSPTDTWAQGLSPARPTEGDRDSQRWLRLGGHFEGKTLLSYHTLNRNAHVCRVCGDDFLWSVQNTMVDLLHKFDSWSSILRFKWTTHYSRMEFSWRATYTHNGSEDLGDPNSQGDIVGLSMGDSSFDKDIVCIKVNLERTGMCEGCTHVVLFTPASVFFDRKNLIRP